MVCVLASRTRTSINDSTGLARRQRPAEGPGRSGDGLDDEVIAGATAKISGKHLSDLRLGRRWMLLEVGIGSQQDSRRAETALKRVLIPKHLLERMKEPLLA